LNIRPDHATFQAADATPPLPEPPPWWIDALLEAKPRFAVAMSCRHVLSVLEKQAPYWIAFERTNGWATITGFGRVAPEAPRLGPPMRNLGRPRPSLAFQIVRQRLDQQRLHGRELAAPRGLDLLDDVGPVGRLVSRTAVGDPAQQVRLPLRLLQHV
jgi:hypothetical protein